jgi:2-polyprenyl-3-methyl-5-hydroxy-6-metoxy-1,4-benzoquinol methylase
VNEREWDAVAATFEEDIFSLPANDRLGLIADRVQRFGGKDKSAADIGCGIGRTLPLLAASFGEVHATDLSNECLEVARRAYAHHANIQYHHGDLAELDQPLPMVDLALCINVLLTAPLARRQAMLNSIASAIKPGGHLLITSPSLESALFATHRLVEWNMAKGMPPAVAQQKAARDASKLDMGVVMVDGVATKHYLKEELEDVLRNEGLVPVESLKIEYPWSIVFPGVPDWLRVDPLPWNWMVLAERVS